MADLHNAGTLLEEGVLVPINKSRLWGSTTELAIANFPVSGLKFSGDFIRVLAKIKLAAAQANEELKQLDKKLAKAIIKAADEIEAGGHLDQFPVDIFQTGSGTSTNMNLNEVIAALANKALGSKDPKHPVHPNDHVNRGQSSNDVFPTAIHVTAAIQINELLIPNLKSLEQALTKKSQKFKNKFKTGRTHLQDATPITLGQEFSGYATQINKSVTRIEAALDDLYELPMGGTAVGTGVNTHPGFGKKVIEKLKTNYKLPFKKAQNPFEAQASKDACVQMSGTLKTVATSLTKMANDLRLMASGPRCGIGELTLPELQPGSSIMPGKVNPVVIEALLQVCAQVIGNDTTITIAGMGGQFELNAMMPVLAHNLFQSVTLLAKATEVFEKKCVRGIEMNDARIDEQLEQSLMLATLLVPKIGYDKAAEIAKKAHREGKTVRQVAEETLGMKKPELEKLFYRGFA